MHVNAYSSAPLWILGPDSHSNRQFKPVKFVKANSEFITYFFKGGK